MPRKSVVILDDFTFRTANNKQSKLDFYKVVNYMLYQLYGLLYFVVLTSLFENQYSSKIEINVKH